MTSPTRARTHSRCCPTRSSWGLCAGCPSAPSRTACWCANGESHMHDDVISNNRPRTSRIVREGFRTITYRKNGKKIKFVVRWIFKMNILPITKLPLSKEDFPSNSLKIYALYILSLSPSWYRIACTETLWQRLDLGNKTLARDSLGRVLDRKPLIVRFANSEVTSITSTCVSLPDGTGAGINSQCA